MQECLENIEEGVVSEAYERAIFASIAVTGVISGIARGSNQTALAHKFYDTTRFLFPEDTKPYLHGEIVGVGLLMQNHFNGAVEDNGFILSLMERYNMPSSVENMGIKKTDEAFKLYYDRICQSSAVDGNNPEECARFKRSLEYLWGIK
jgi:glycerol dehydrogenase